MAVGTQTLSPPALKDLTAIPYTLLLTPYILHPTPLALNLICPVLRLALNHYLWRGNQVAGLARSVK